MDIFNVFSLLGGLAMFLYGMRLMGNALKENSSGALKRAMESVTNNPVKAFFLGLMVTAVIQSSTATIVITAGLVGAGLLTLHQSLGIIIGANVGTTVTGQIIRLLDLDASGGATWLRFFQPSTLAPIALIVGMVLIMCGPMKNAKSVGNIAIGFGILFSGLLNMTGAVKTLTESGFVEGLFSQLGENPLIGYLTGAAIAFMLQSSSATIGILQAFSASGLLQFKSIYALIVGVYLGDCVTTAIVCSIGAKAEARRVGMVNILYNLGKSVLVLLAVTVIHKLGLIDTLWDTTVNSGIIADTNTIFNLGCAVALFPLLGLFERTGRAIIRDDPVKEEKYKEKLEALNPVFFTTPALALYSCYEALLTSFNASRSNIEKALGLLEKYDPRVYDGIMAEEDEIDSLTDHVSHYTVELLPHLQNEAHVAILNQYYKVTAEFERLGDHAVNIAENAAQLAKRGMTYSDEAKRELRILKKTIGDILDKADLAFRKRDVDAAYGIEPLVQVTDEIIDLMKRSHLKRMGTGECSVFADVSFTNLMNDLKRIADVCSNVGVATAVRVNPELAEHEHYYYEKLHSGGDETFNRQYNEAHEQYFSLLHKEKSAPGKEPGAESAGGEA
ncbi:MAG: Na/Pi cotransporter family protein [Oscillospiraceae bacterium]|nr:Na/Pi cotransporter family protein [Oscillospiraceae bacterium]